MFFTIRNGMVRVYVAAIQCAFGTGGEVLRAVQEEVVVEGVRDVHVCQEVVRAAEELWDQHLAELEQCVQLMQTARIWRRLGFFLLERQDYCVCHK